MLKEPLNSTQKWSDWSDCSKPCGVGQKIRYMECLTLEADTNCDPQLQEIKPCQIKKCSHPLKFLEIVNFSMNY